MARELALIVSITMMCMLSPGPDMVLVMRNTLTGDRRSGLVTSLGVLTGNCVHISYCALGVGVLLAHSVLAYSVLKLAGAAYLIFLGISGIRGAKAGEAPASEFCSRADPRASTQPAHEPASVAAEPSSRPAQRPYLEGLLNNLLNPKGALFYLGVFTQVITPGTPPAHGLLLVLAMVSTSALFWIAFVATLHLPSVRTVLARSRRSVERVFGVLLVLLGLRVAAQD